MKIDIRYKIWDRIQVPSKYKEEILNHLKEYKEISFDEIDTICAGTQIWKRLPNDEVLVQADWVTVEPSIEVLEEGVTIWTNIPKELALPGDDTCSSLEWDEIQRKLTSSLGICKCQRKLRSIVLTLYRINDVLKVNDTNAIRQCFEPSDYLICALLENSGLLEHGTNAEYPIRQKVEWFWDWIDEVVEKYPQFLKDN